MTRSQNGWTANDRSYISTYTIAGAKFPVRRGSVAIVLMYVAQQFHSKVEKLNPKECYGYAERKIRGSSTTVSNHASGTSIDLNASKHWLGDRNTFSKAQVAQIRKILKACGGVVRWGGDYRSRKDEMHFEINAGSAAVNKVAAKLKGKSPTSTTAKPEPSASKPASAKPKPSTSKPQNVLKRLSFPLSTGYYFGPKKGGNKSVSGFYNRKFKGQTDRYWIKQFAEQLRLRGWSVGKGKKYLRTSGNDGKFGNEYAALVKAFQKDQKMRNVDGLIGKNTWYAAFNNKIT